jgi:uncharacterized protein
MTYLFEWDESKNAANLRKHKISFDAVERFDWDTADIEVDDRDDCSELRGRAVGFIGDVLYLLVFTERDEVMRIISLRKANQKERDRYGR